MLTETKRESAQLGAPEASAREAATAAGFAATGGLPETADGPGDHPGAGVASQSLELREEAVQPIGQDAAQPDSGGTEDSRVADIGTVSFADTVGRSSDGGSFGEKDAGTRGPDYEQPGISDSFWAGQAAEQAADATTDAEGSGGQQPPEHRVPAPGGPDDGEGDSGDAFDWQPDSSLPIPAAQFDSERPYKQRSRLYEGSADDGNVAVHTLTVMSGKESYDGRHAVIDVSADVIDGDETPAPKTLKAIVPLPENSVLGEYSRYSDFRGVPAEHGRDDLEQASAERNEQVADKLQALSVATLGKVREFAVQVEEDGFLSPYGEAAYHGREAVVDAEHEPEEVADVQLSKPYTEARRRPTYRGMSPTTEYDVGLGTQGGLPRAREEVRDMDIMRGVAKRRHGGESGSAYRATVDTDFSHDSALGRAMHSEDKRQRAAQAMANIAGMALEEVDKVNRLFADEESQAAAQAEADAHAGDLMFTPPTVAFDQKASSSGNSKVFSSEASGIPHSVDVIVKKASDENRKGMRKTVIEIRATGDQNASKLSKLVIEVPFRGDSITGRSYREPDLQVLAQELTNIGMEFFNELRLFDASVGTMIHGD